MSSRARTSAFVRRKNIPDERRRTDNSSKCEAPEKSQCPNSSRFASQYRFANGKKGPQAFASSSVRRFHSSPGLDIIGVPVKSTRRDDLSANAFAAFDRRAPGVLM
jgi:hypothetical protein